MYEVQIPILQVTTNNCWKIIITAQAIFYSGLLFDDNIQHTSHKGMVN